MFRLFRRDSPSSNRRQEFYILAEGAAEFGSEATGHAGTAEEALRSAQAARVIVAVQRLS